MGDTGLAIVESTRVRTPVSAYLLVQISDVHLTLNGTLPPGVRPRDNLVRGLQLLATSGVRPTPSS
jgi:hypothetical protein